jgi:hypothetical protein
MALEDFNVLLDEQIVSLESFLASQVHSFVGTEGLEAYHFLS